MEANTISFDHLPRLVYELGRKLDELTNLINAQVAGPVADRWMNLQEFCEYHPAKPAGATVYAWVQAGAVPHSRQGKRLLFRQSEIDAWLASKATTSASSIKGLAEKRFSTVRPTRPKGVRR